MYKETNGKIDIRGVLFDNVNKEEASARVVEYLSGTSVHAIYTPNAEIVQACIEDENIKKIINSADMVIPDGAGVVLASKILKTPLKEKVAGIELAEFIIDYAAKTKKRIYFLGSKPASEGVDSIAVQAEKKLAEKYEGFELCGWHDGYFKDGDNSVIEDINKSNADCVFVCLGAPRQEKWIYANKDKLNTKVLIGLGGSLDVFSGNVKRAPELFVKFKLEWFYRLLKQPSRLGRMMKLPKFVFGTMLYKSKNK